MAWQSSEIVRVAQTLSKEKRDRGVEAAEMQLSELSHKTSSPELFLKAKAATDTDQQVLPAEKMEGLEISTFLQAEE